MSSTTAPEFQKGVISSDVERKSAVEGGFRPTPTRQTAGSTERPPVDSSVRARWRAPWHQQPDERHGGPKVANDQGEDDAQSTRLGTTGKERASVSPAPAGDASAEGDDELVPARRFGAFRLRGVDDDEPQDWWFASTAIPLVAATFGPLANLMSVCALVTSWRNNIVEDPLIPTYQTSSIGYPDPRWCIALNAASLVLGFLGNFFLLLNFTQAMRYLLALPLTIIFWYGATGLLTGITIAINEFQPPGENQIYSQGYWYAIIASCLYMTCSMLLMVNMLGYFLGHYPQNFILTDDQRQLILQTMIFFVWLGGGGAVFANTDDMKFVDAVYFCDITILTIGFGDFHPTNDLSRGLVFPYSVGGIIILGLMVSSLHKFAGQLSQEKVIQKHVDRRRVHTIKRAVTTDQDPEKQDPSQSTSSEGDQSLELYSAPGQSDTSERHGQPMDDMSQGSHMIDRPHSASPADALPVNDAQDTDSKQVVKRKLGSRPSRTMMAVSKPVRVLTGPVRRMMINNREKRAKAIVMAEEKDRFDAMRNIQRKTSQFKKYYTLTISIVVFLIIWTVGAVGFWKAEQNTQGLTYFQALYLGYVSLTTIGYGDLSPSSNAGKPLFVLWSLIAVPTMTILISSMGDTVIDSIQKGTFRLADWTILPKKGLYRAFLIRNPWLWNWMKRKVQKQKRNGSNPSLDESPPRTIEQLAQPDSYSETELTRQLALAIRRTANDVKDNKQERYSYEEWVEFTRLIRFTHDDDGAAGLEQDEEEYGIVEWDFLGEDSPMLSGCESEWVMDRLCESLLRLLRRGVSAGTALKVEPGEGEVADLEKAEEGVISPEMKYDDNGDWQEAVQETNSTPREGTSHRTSFHQQARASFSIHPRPNRSRAPSSCSSSARSDYSSTVEPRQRGIGLFPELGLHSP